MIVLKQLRTTPYDVQGLFPEEIVGSIDEPFKFLTVDRRHCSVFFKEAGLCDDAAFKIEQPVHNEL